MDPSEGERIHWRVSKRTVKSGGVQRLNYKVIIDTMRSVGVETIILNLLSYKAPHIDQQPFRCCYHPLRSGIVVKSGNILMKRIDDVNHSEREPQR